MNIRIIVCLLMSFATISALADMIVKKDGTTLNVYNVEVGPKFVTFTKDASPDSELGRVRIEECFGIKTGDGEMIAVETLSNSQSSQTTASNTNQSTQPKVIEAVAASDNKKLIDMYNSVFFEYPSKDKEDVNKLHSGMSLIIWGVGEESVLSDENMLILIEEVEWAQYKISVTNKTDNNLYIDMTNSFRISRDGIASAFYDGSVYSSNTEKGSGGGLNLGAVTGALGVGGALGTLASGMNVGGGSSSSMQVTKTEQPVVIIPPHSKIVMPLKKKAKGKDLIELPEIFHYAGSYSDLLNSAAFDTYWGWGDRSNEISKNETSIYSSQIKLNKNGFSEIKQSDSPKTYKYLISYSTSPEFNDVYRAGFSIYMRGIYGFKPISKSTGLSGKLYKFYKNDRNLQMPLIWGFGSIEK